ncbi:hypothetical protein ABZP36_031610 [Zizania latifolia]
MRLHLHRVPLHGAPPPPPSVAAALHGTAPPLAAAWAATAPHGAAPPTTVALTPPSASPPHHSRFRSDLRPPGRRISVGQRRPLLCRRSPPPWPPAPTPRTASTDVCASTVTTAQPPSSWSLQRLHRRLLIPYNLEREFDPTGDNVGAMGLDSLFLMRPTKGWSVRLAPEEESHKLTGFVHSAVTCIGMETDIPVIIDEAITKFDDDFFWLGGGEGDLKLGMRTSQFQNTFNPFMVKCS